MYNTKSINNLVTLKCCERVISFCSLVAFIVLLIHLLGTWCNVITEKWLNIANTTDKTYQWSSVLQTKQIEWSSVLQTEHTNGHLYYIQNIAMIICNTNRTYQWSPVLQTEHSNSHLYYKQNISMVICKTNVLGLLAKSWYWLLLLFSKKIYFGDKNDYWLTIYIIV